MKKKLSAEQVIVPMVSPFTARQEIDRDAVSRMCAMFAGAGVSVFALGTTGEGDSMSREQREVLVEAVVREVSGKVKVYAGLTGNSLSESVRDAKKYAALGADYLVAKLPAYYPMDENQMLQYFERLADSVDLPLFIYNIPGTTHHSIPLNIVDILSYHPQIAGLKDSERDENRLRESVLRWGGREDFDFLIGWAAMSANGLQLGANGIVPSTGNLCPELYVQLVDHIAAGNIGAAFQCQELTDRVSALYQKGRNLSQSIAALKVLMKQNGLCSGEVLLPMITMDTEEEEKYLAEIKTEWENLNLK